MRRRKKPKRRGYVRPSRAAPKTGWSLRELARLSDLSVRAARHYLQRGLVPKPPFKGPATRYQRRQLLFLLAIRRLLGAEKLSLTDARSRLHTLSPQELEAFATEDLAPGPAATALGVQPKLPKSPAAPTPQIAAHVPRWAHVELALGLELHVREDASDAVLALANRLMNLALTKT